MLHSELQILLCILCTIDIPIHTNTNRDSYKKELVPKECVESGKAIYTFIYLICLYPLNLRYDIKLTVIKLHRLDYYSRKFAFCLNNSANNNGIASRSP